MIAVCLTLLVAIVAKLLVNTYIYRRRSAADQAGESNDQMCIAFRTPSSR